MSERMGGPRRNARSGARVLLAMLAAALVAWPLGVDAQQRGPQGRRGDVDREQLERRIRAQMGRMMQQRLGLDAQQSEQLAQVVQDFESRRRELFQEEQTTRREVEAFLRGDAADAAQARELVTRVAELRLQEAELFGQEQEALLEVLTPVQLLRLQELRQELGQRIRALRGGRGGDSDRRRGPGPGPDAFRDGP
ncbi:MAG TPA: Spy/CpxP family protein refolding chaperone [Longimicrobiales bacterium]|nr:Spy/CpxP family protein refolding chaperone [Longimicrobiales bacterium]